MLLSILSKVELTNWWNVIWQNKMIDKPIVIV